MRDNTHTVQNTKKKKYFQSSELEQRRINLNRNGGEGSSGQPEIGDRGVRHYFYSYLDSICWAFCLQTNERIETQTGPSEHFGNKVVVKK